MRRCARWAQTSSSSGATSTRRAKRSSTCRPGASRDTCAQRTSRCSSLGVGTLALEIFEDLPDVDVILVPIGGGSGACGCSIVRSGIGSRAKIIGVQAERADAFARSWRAFRHAQGDLGASKGGITRVVGDKADTFAEGMATRVTFDLTFGILQRELDDIVTLTEEELAEGVRLALRATHNLAEGAGAAPLMAAMKLRDQLAGKKIVRVMSGGNIDAATLKRILGLGSSPVPARPPSA